MDIAPHDFFTIDSQSGDGTGPKLGTIATLPNLLAKGTVMVSIAVRPASRGLNFWLCLGVPAGAATLLLLLELTTLDMDLMRLFYDPIAGEFIGRRSFLLEDILHDRAKQVVIALSVFAIIGFIASFFTDRLQPFKRELGCLVLSLALATAFVTPIKAVTAVQCPWSLEQFGGQETYSQLLSPRPPTNKPGRCWPGGHAATGFTWFALFFVLRDRRPRLAKQAFVLALALGTVFAIGRTIQGAHFFSHNVWTAIFCWLICLGTYCCVLYRPAPSTGTTRLERPVST